VARDLTESIKPLLPEAIGRYRRYTKDSLLAITPPGVTPVKTRYLDASGLMASAANRWLLSAFFRKIRNGSCLSPGPISWDTLGVFPSGSWIPYLLWPCILDPDNPGVMAKQNYDVGSWVDFSTAGASAAYLLTGWSDAEPWGRWSDGGMAKLALFPGKILVTGLEIEAQAFVTEKDRSQTVNVFVNRH
jgi:hypothetical protein